MNITTITCQQCGTKSEKPKKEIDRQQRKGRTKFYCSLSCAAHASNPIMYPSLNRFCVLCGKEFMSVYRSSKYTRFCSRSCASSGSLTAHRLETAKQVGKKVLSPPTIYKLAQYMRQREAYKYLNIAKELDNLNISYIFESPFPCYPKDEFTKLGIIVDLELPGLNVVIEFDGLDHSKTTKYDYKRDKYLSSIGFKVYRVDVSGIEPPYSFSIIENILGLNVKQ